MHKKVSQFDRFRLALSQVYMKGNNPQGGNRKSGKGKKPRDACREAASDVLRSSSGGQSQLGSHHCLGIANRKLAWPAATSGQNFGGLLFALEPPPMAISKSKILTIKPASLKGSLL
jgi:hypothetical protein